MTDAAPPTTYDQVIRGSLPCIKCSYDLDTRAVGTPCPECGVSTVLSVESMWLEDPAYVRRLWRGLNLMVVASLLGPAVYATFVVLMLLGMDGPGSEEFLVFLGAVVLSAGPVLAWLGVGRFAVPRPGKADESRSLLVAARVLAIAFAVCFALAAMLLVLRAWSWARPEEELVVFVFLAAGECWCFRNVVFIAQIRVIARRSCMSRIAAASAFFQVVAVCLAVGGGLLGVALLAGVRGRPSWMYFVPYFAVAAGLVVWLMAWPIYVGRTARGLRRILRQFEKDGRPRVAPIEPPSA